MWTELFNTKVAAQAGNKIADHFLAAQADAGRKGRKSQSASEEALIHSLLLQVDREVRPLKLGIFRRAKFANTFKWRLLESGVGAAAADQVTRILLLHLSQKPQRGKS
jgi:hypothetical protein